MSSVSQSNIYPRIVASYTTIPSRYDVLYNSINTLLSQTVKLDAIYVTIPYYSTRLKQAYPPIPDKLANICTVIRSDIDYGPCSKLYGALISESDPDTCIISCDDDVKFTSNFVEKLINHHIQYPNIVISGTGALIGRGLFSISIVSTLQGVRMWRGFTGFDVGKSGRRVDLIFGVAGVLYPRKAFPDKSLLHDELFSYALKDDSLFHNDDVIISGFLSKQGIERKVFCDIPEIKHVGGTDALSQIPNMLSRLNHAIKQSKKFGLFTNMEPCPIDETIAGRSIILIILIIIGIILCIIYYMFVI